MTVERGFPHNGSAVSWILIISAFVGIPASVVTVILFFQQQQANAEARQREEDAANEALWQQVRDGLIEVRVDHVKYSPGLSAQLSLRNSSQKRTVTVNEVRFVISNPESLRIIEKVHPRPMIGSATPITTVEVVGGQWQGDSFVFSQVVSCYMKVGEPHEIALKFKDLKLAGREFYGMIEIDCDDGYGNHYIHRENRVKMTILHPATR